MARVRPAVRCSARRGDGQPCRGYAIVGGSVCDAHGGRAGQVRAAAQRRVAQAKAKRIVLSEGYREVADPVTALARLAGEIEALKDALGQAAAGLEIGSLDGASPVLDAYERALDRTRQILVAMVRLGLEARLVQLDERQAQVMEAVLEAALAELRLPARAADRARAVLTRELDAVSSS